MVNTIINEMIPSVSTGGLLKGIFIFLVVILVMAIIGAWLFLYFRNRKFKEFKIVILEKDSTGNVREYYDKGGVFLNKQSQLKLLFLQKIKKGLNPNNIPYVTAVDKKGRLIKTVYLLRTGVSNYRYVHVRIENDVLKFTVGEEDVNWAAQDYEIVTKTFQKEGFWAKYGGYVLFIVTIVIIMVIIISLFNKFEILKDVATSLQQVGDNMLEIAKVLNESKAPGMPIIIGGG